MTDTKAQLAKSLAVLGTILGKNGSQQEGMEAFREALEILRQLAVKDPLQFMPQLANSLCLAGVMLSRFSQWREARQLLLEALSIFRDLAGDAPARFLPALAECLGHLGWVLLNLDRPSESLEALRESVNLYKSFVPQHPDAFRQHYARTLNYLSCCLLTLDLPQDALDVANEARQILAPWTADYPDMARELDISLKDVIRQAAQRAILVTARVERDIAQQEQILRLPQLNWNPKTSPPASLLRADFGVVPFHGRDREFKDLLAWCQEPDLVRVRLYTGSGGIGKTRLALEVARHLRSEGWKAGFLVAEAIPSPGLTWKAVSGSGGKALVIVDYAETRREILIPLLRHLYASDIGPIRLLLLARTALDWWEQLKAEGQGVGELLSGPATSRHSLAPLALSREEQWASYRLASQAFAKILGREPSTEMSEDLAAKPFERVLILHMAALASVLEVPLSEEDGVLDSLVYIERREWESRALARNLPAAIVHGIGRAMAAITLGGGVNGEAEALEVLRSLRYFADQPASVLTAVARLLHECYPGERWIEPIQPDLLGEHLVQRELEQGADELLDLVLGPRTGA